MAVRLVEVAALPVVFAIGAAATIDPRLSIVAIGLFILAAIIKLQFRPVKLNANSLKAGVQSDWILVVLPTAIAIRTFSSAASLAIIGLLVAVAWLRKADERYVVKYGPMVLLLAASAIVFSRPAYMSTLITFILVSVLVLRLINTVDARRIFVSIVDGCGLYLVANVFCYMIGLQSPDAALRIGGLIESTGFVRVIFPLTSSLNAPPTMAGFYIVGSVLLLFESGWIKRSLRIVGVLAAIFVLISAGTRVPIVAAAALTLLIICFPIATRWLAQAATVLAAISALILPTVIASIQNAIVPFVSLAPGRDIKAGSISTLNNRDFIWERSLRFWNEWVTDTWQTLFGFGVNGQFRSGASLSYSDRLAGLVRDPELASVHNSFLQQLFDGGIIGWLLLALAAYWASSRLASRQRGWGYLSLSVIGAMTVLLVSSMSEVSLAPGSAQDSFWLLMVVVGMSCQTARREANETLESAKDFLGKSGLDQNLPAAVKETNGQPKLPAATSATGRK